MSLLERDLQREPFAELSRFRGVFYDCLTGRRDALFELTDSVLCTDGPVKTLVGLALAPEHRRGHGALYGALNRGCLDVERLRAELVGLPLPRAAPDKSQAEAGVPNTGAAHRHQMGSDRVAPPPKRVISDRDRPAAGKCPPGCGTCLRLRRASMTPPTARTRNRPQTSTPVATAPPN
ncbi:hypothetical protein GCM10010195_45900 [Kitasatospora griseola]|nr:hypothetical protein GCM10010195_45900 [Kitasatospora griseola]